MQIGNTSSSITISELFNRYSETRILTTVFPEITQLPCKINSPLRKDNNPSFSIYLDVGKHVRFKDFGDPECRGGLLDLLCKYWKCTFNQVFHRILEVMQDQCHDGEKTKIRQVKTLTRRESSSLSKIEVKVRPWQQYDYDYWASYGVEKQWLHYAEIYPISHKVITKKDKETGKTSSHIFGADKYAYCFVERKEGLLSLKIYQPYNTKGFKWCSKMDASVIGLWTKIPEYGDKVVLCSSMKDALALSCQCHIPALCLQGEGYNLSETAASELRRRYKQVFICYDTDSPGIANARKLSEATGFPYVVPDLKGQKDLSDYYKSLKNKEDFQKLKALFHYPVPSVAVPQQP